MADARAINLSQLDALQVGAPVLGDEQVLDVELDRHTVFLPMAKHTHGSDPWDLDHTSIRVQAEPAPALPGAFLSYLFWL
jgi:hypothetical protein